MNKYWRSRAIIPSDPSTLNGLDIQKHLTDPTLTGPETQDDDESDDESEEDID